jgi:hypothetical protein
MTGLKIFFSIFAHYLIILLVKNDPNLNSVAALFTLTWLETAHNTILNSFLSIFLNYLFLYRSVLSPQADLCKKLNFLRLMDLSGVPFNF